MDANKILKRLINADVVKDANGQITPTEDFAARRADVLEDENTRNKSDWENSNVIDDGDDDFLATVTTIAEFVEEMSEQDILVAARVFDRLENPPTSSGAPENFVPLHQEDIQGFLMEHAAAVIYVWKPKNTPCAEMAETLSQLHELSAVDETVGLGSICVEDGADRLREEYDVGILPTTLYFVGQTVDMRSVGVRNLEHVERQAQIITDLANRTSTADTQSDA